MSRTLASKAHDGLSLAILATVIAAVILAITDSKYGLPAFVIAVSLVGLRALLNLLSAMREGAVYQFGSRIDGRNLRRTYSLLVIANALIVSALVSIGIIAALVRLN